MFGDECLLFMMISTRVHGYSHAVSAFNTFINDGSEGGEVEIFSLGVLVLLRQDRMG